VQTNRKPLLGGLLILAGLALCAAAVRLAVQPEMYCSSARIKFDLAKLNNQPPAPEPAVKPDVYDSDFIPTEFEVIQSETILGKVIDKLDLNREWGRRFAKGRTLKWSETLALLRTRLELRPVRSTTLVDIRVVSEDPGEASKIANAIAESYAEWRRDAGHRLIEESLKSLETRAQEQKARIKVASENLETLRKEVGLSEKQPAELDKLYPEYARAKLQLEDMNDFLQLLERKIKLEKDELLVPQSAQVEIIERAVPPLRPVSPNGPFKAALVLTSFLAGVAAIGFGIRLLRRR
jgi:uncharacterized protein involved in exopolysaccharide biosynthesis